MTEQGSRREFIAAAVAAVPAFAQKNIAGMPPDAPVEVKEVGAYSNDKVVQTRIRGQQFALYNYEPHQGALYKPFFHPVMGPNGKPITQSGEFPGTLLGHYWHRALFVAHQKVNGTSFWEERANCGRMVHLAFDTIESGKQEGSFVERLAWRDAAGNDVIHETRTVRFPDAPAGARVIDIHLSLQPARGDVEFAATPYNLLACRVINSIAPVALKQQYTSRFASLADFSPLAEGGKVVNSEGKQDTDCMGARARWCDISGPLGDGSVGGVAILDHPGNPRHPTAWHNWKNMTITASFTFHEPFILQAGQQLDVAYRVLVHAGDARTAEVEAAWKSYAKTDWPGRRV